MKRLTKILTEILLGLIMTVFIVVSIPIIIIVMPFTYYINWKRERQLKKYVSKLGEKNFFCYNNRTDAKAFIEKELIPKLHKDIELIYLDGRQPISSYAHDHISLALYKLKNYTRFPHLLKIRDGQMIDESVNNEFFNTMTQNKPLDKLLDDINVFFGLTGDNKNAA